MHRITWGWTRLTIVSHLQVFLLSIEFFFSIADFWSYQSILTVQRAQEVSVDSSSIMVILACGRFKGKSEATKSELFKRFFSFHTRLYWSISSYPDKVRGTYLISNSSLFMLGWFIRCEQGFWTRVVYSVNVKAGIFPLTRHHPGSPDLCQRDCQTMSLEWDSS